MDPSVKVGLRVVRGPSWRWENQDKGEGQVGTVVECKQAEKEVIVYWDSGLQANYRVDDDDGEYDLRIVDSAATGVKHNGSTCSICKEANIAGMKWKCSVCSNVELCSTCYMGDKHNLSHAFLRIDTPSTQGVKVPKREGSERIPMNGIFVGARVIRGRNWEWNNQDKILHQTVRCDRCNENPLVGIRWKCRTCQDFDLCSDCYKSMAHEQHNFLKIKTPSSVPIVAEARDAGSLLAGKLFGLLLNAEGIDVDLNGEDSIPEPGQVTKLRSWYSESSGRGAVDVKWPNGQSFKYRLGHDGKVDLKYVSCTTGGLYYKDSLPVLGEKPKVEHKFDEGDLVCVESNILKLKLLQIGHGGWAPSMGKIAGSKGEVVGYDSCGNVRVKFEDKIWSLNPDACTPIQIKVGLVEFLMAMAVSEMEEEEKVMVSVLDTNISVGDYVKVNMEEDILKMFQEQTVGWLPLMSQVIGKVGKVSMVTKAIVMVAYEDSSKQLPFNPAVVTKVSPVSKGDQVMISRDLQMVKKLQEEHGGWVPDMAFVLGKNGIVETVLGENKLLVKTGSHSWCFNANACILVKKKGEIEHRSDGVARSSDGAANRELKQKLEDMEAKIHCNICYDKRRSVVFGCGHSACSDCAKQLNVCHICRSKITQKINIFE